MPAEQENILSLMLRDPASAGVFYATAEAQEKIEAELQAAQERVDCGGVNCGKCQQCLTVNQWALQQALQAAQEALAHYAEEAHWTEEKLGDIYTTWGYDGGEEFPWTIARKALAAQLTDEPSDG